MGTCASICCDTREPRKHEKFVTVKILLLGAGESGKSTILKQMRIIHKDGFSLADRLARRPAVFTDLINSMVSLIYGALALRPEGLRPTIHQDLANLRMVASRNIESKLPEQVARLIQELWDDPVMKRVYEQRNQFQINDAAAYFFDELDRIRGYDYMPTDEDILVTRVESTGIQEMRYTIKNVVFNVFDMPGQRSQRRKWLNYFQNVDAVIFISAISEYDQKIREDNNTHRLMESINLFEIVANSQYFNESQVILFMNKKDLFLEKLTRSPIKNYFDKFRAENTYANGMKFFRRQFLERTVGWRKDRRLHIHETCATDTSQLAQALAEATEHVVTLQLEKAGLI